MKYVFIIVVLILSGGCAQQPPHPHQPSSRWVQTDEAFRSYTTYQYRNYPGRIADSAARTTAREISRQLNQKILERLR